MYLTYLVFEELLYKLVCVSTYLAGMLADFSLITERSTALLSPYKVLIYFQQTTYLSGPRLIQMVGKLSPERASKYFS